MLPLNIGTERALQKIKHYCGYQERSHAEVRQKLYGFGLRKHEVETLLSQVIEEDYLNEERYAMAFAGGKFRIKQWGKVKIEHALKQKGVSSYSLKKAMAAIPEADYSATFKKLYRIKKQSLSAEKNIFVKRTKLRNYLLQKGFEYFLVTAAFAEEDHK